LFSAVIESYGLRSKTTPVSQIKAVRDRIIPRLAAPVNSVTVVEVCDAYLSKVKTDGADVTYKAHGDTLFDFCYGLSPRFRTSREIPKARDYLHKGYGDLGVAQLLSIHVDRWLQGHVTWKSARRIRIQAWKRALNYGVES
jgi:hypothetical protein